MKHKAIKELEHAQEENDKKVRSAQEEWDKERSRIYITIRDEALAQWKSASIPDLPELTYYNKGEFAWVVFGHVLRLNRFIASTGQTDSVPFRLLSMKEMVYNVAAADEDERDMMGYAFAVVQNAPSAVLLQFLMDRSEDYIMYDDRVNPEDGAVWIR